MAVDYLKAYELGRNSHFERRVHACAVETALQVMAEDPATANHAARAAFAVDVLNGTNDGRFQMLLAVATNPTILATVTKGPASEAGVADISDGDIEYQLEQVWNALSGVSG